MERMYTEAEACKLAEQVLERFSSKHPLPTAVSLKQAAEMLGVSVRTAVRLKLPRNKFGRIPYEAVLDARAAVNK